jgi:hypothetical protein
MSNIGRAPPCVFGIMAANGTGSSRLDLPLFSARGVRPQASWSAFLADNLSQSEKN